MRVLPRQLLASSVFAFTCGALAATSLAQQNAAGLSSVHTRHLKPWEVVLSPENRTRANALDAQVTHYREQTRYQDAIPVAEQLVELYSQAKGEQHWKTREWSGILDQLEQIAVLPPAMQADLSEADRAYTEYKEFMSRHEYANAAGAIRTQLEIRRRIWGRHHLDVAQSLHHLARVYFAQRDLEAARQLYQESLEIKLSIRTADSPGTATTMSNLAGVLLLKGEIDSAELLFREALRIRRGLLGDHAAVVSSLQKLARVLGIEGDFAAAQQMLHEAWSMAERLFSDGHLVFAGLMTEHADLLRRQGDNAGAEALYRRALALRKRSLGDEDVLVANAACDLAGLLQRKGDHEAAELLYRKAMAIRAKVLGEGHPDYALAMGDLAVVLGYLGKYDQSEQMFRESLRIRQQVLPQGDCAVAEIMSSLALMLTRRGDSADVEKLYREALSVSLRTVGDDDPRTALRQHNLATALAKSGNPGNFDEAEALYRAALDTFQKWRSSRWYLSAAGYARLMLWQLDRPAEAVPLFADAMNHVEGLRDRVGGDELDRARYGSVLQNNKIYGGMSRAQVMMGRADGGVAYLERGRGRAVLDLLGRRGVDLTASVLELAKKNGNAYLSRQVNNLSEQETSARKRVLALQTQIENAKNSSDNSAEQRVERVAELLEQLGEARDQERLASRKLYDLARSELGGGLEPLTSAQIQKHLRPDEMLLMYDVGEYDSMVFVLRPTGKPIQAVTLKWGDGSDVEERSLEATINRLFGAMSREKIAGNPRLQNATVHSADELALALLPSMSQPDGPQPDASTELSTGGRGSNALREELACASRVFVIPDGALHRLPFEVLELDTDRRWLDVMPPISYAPSCTVALLDRLEQSDHNKASPADAPLLVALGDPVFSRGQAAEEPQVPDYGLLITRVTPDSNADRNGLKAGDVLLSYNNVKLNGLADLKSALAVIKKRTQKLIGHDASESTNSGASPSPASNPEGSVPGSQSAVGTRQSAVKNSPNSVLSPKSSVPTRVWRDGQLLDLELEPGKLGLRPSKTSMPQALVDYRDSQLSEEQRYVAVARSNSLDPFGRLYPLPGSRTEVQAIAALAAKASKKPNAVRTLLGEQATCTNLFAAAKNARYLHLATHGRVLGGPRVYDSALATTLPQEVTAEDYGFLTLKDLMNKWQGRLDGTELVTLSACRTAQGRQESGEGFVALTWGFMFAGADSVLATLWNVDDVSTSILMEEFYRNLLERHMAKSDALAAAKRMLRGLTAAQVRERLASRRQNETDLSRPGRTRDLLTDAPVKAKPLEPSTLRPYADPYYWAPFVLVGDPD